MKHEGSTYDRKSLRCVQGRTADFGELVKDAVAFANAKGGVIDIGIEDDHTEPPPGQVVDAGLPERIRRRVREQTVNVELVSEVVTAANGGQFIRMRVERALSPASTSDARYYLRIDDQSRPLMGDDVLRLVTDRASVPWETLTHLRVERSRIDPVKTRRLLAALRASERVSERVKSRRDEDLLEHYLLVDGEWLTNLGVLCIGRQMDRARLGTAPVIQAIKYDEQERKINKWVWDDHTLSPMELLDAVWAEVPDFRESYELPAGLLRESLPAYDEKVVRELLVNALVHRPYTQRGDIYINLYPDRMEMVNPGRFPPGVTAENLLHKSVRRNDLLARLFHDLKLMEREGSGIDLMYETLLSQGRPAPVHVEEGDSVRAVVQRHVVRPEVIDFMTRVDRAFQLSHEERICLGLLVQHEAVSAVDLARRLGLKGAEVLRPWLGRLRELGLVETKARTKGTRYFVPPAVLREMAFTTRTTLARIEDHRLRALIIEDLESYPGARIGEIHRRIGSEIDRDRLKDEIDGLIRAGTLRAEGATRARGYWLVGAA